MPPGQRLAYIGLAISADWLRLKKHRVVGEVTVLYDRNVIPARIIHLNDVEIHNFWRSGRNTQEAVLENFRLVGARWVAADYVPSWADTTGWCKVGGIGVNTAYIRPLRGQECVSQL